jgi:hypothetical protein
LAIDEDNKKLTFKVNYAERCYFVPEKDLVLFEILTGFFLLKMYFNF